MPSTPSAIGNIELFEEGEKLLWGDDQTRVMQRLTEMSKGVKTIALAGSRALTSTNYVENEARYAVLVFTGGSIVAPATVTIPAQVGTWVVYNFEAYPITFSLGSGDTFAIPAGRAAEVATDGVDVFGMAYASPADAAAAVAAAVAAGASATSAASSAGTATTQKNLAVTAKEEAQAAAALAVANALYTPDPAGSVSRATVLKLKERASIMDFLPYSASSMLDIGDKAQAIVDFAVSGGKQIFVPSRTFVLSDDIAGYYALPLVGVSGFSIIGEGAGSSIFKVGSGVARGPIAFDDCSDIEIQRITFDGSRESTTSQGLHGIRIDDVDGIILNGVRVLNAKGYGIGFQGGGYKGGVIQNFEVEGSCLDGIDIKNNGSLNEPFRISNGLIRNAGMDPAATSPMSLDFRAPGSVVSNVVCLITETGIKTGGIRTRQDTEDQGKGGRFSTISSCHVRGLPANAIGGGRGFELDGDYTLATNCSVEDYLGAAGFYIGGNFVRVANCAVKGAENGFWAIGDDASMSHCQADANSGAGFRLDACDRTFLADCQSHGNDYGVREVNGATATWLHDHKARENTSFNYGLSSTYRAFNCEGLTTSIKLYAAGAVQFELGADAAAVNRLVAYGSAASPFLKAEGTSTNLDIRLQPKGSGAVRFGTHTASADAAITGYISIRDDAGTVRKIAVIT